MTAESTPGADPSPVGAAYDGIAETYASLFLAELDDASVDGGWLDRFVSRLPDGDDPVGDLGCGPGQVSDRLHRAGVPTLGLDCSAGQIREARRAFPALRFAVGDLTALDPDTHHFRGIAARYSIIHLPPPQLADVFTHWADHVVPGGPVLVTFFGARRVDDHGLAFDHKVITAHALWPATVAGLLLDAGFVDAEVGAVPIPAGGRPFDQAGVLVRRPG